MSFAHRGPPLGDDLPRVADDLLLKQSACLRAEGPDGVEHRERGRRLLLGVCLGAAIALERDEEDEGDDHHICGAHYGVDSARRNRILEERSRWSAPPHNSMPAALTAAAPRMINAASQGSMTYAGTGDRWWHPDSGGRAGRCLRWSDAPTGTTGAVDDRRGARSLMAAMLIRTARRGQGRDASALISDREAQVTFCRPRPLLAPRPQRLELRHVDRRTLHQGPSCRDSA